MLRRCYNVASFLVQIISLFQGYLKRTKHICDALRDLVPFVQPKKREKHSLRCFYVSHTDKLYSSYMQITIQKYMSLFHGLC